MTPETLLGIYRRAMDRCGEPVVIVAARVANQSGPRAQGPSRARVMNHSPVEIVGGITAGNRKAIILHEDLAASPYPAGIRKGAEIRWNGLTLLVLEVDNGTRRVKGVPIAYVCDVSGA